MQSKPWKALALAFILAAGFGAVCQAAPVTRAQRFLLRMDLGGRPNCWVAADAWVQKDGDRYTGWNLTVQWFPVGREDKAGATVTRHYGYLVGNEVGGQNLRLDLDDTRVTLDLPTPAGDALVPLTGFVDGQGHWYLHGDAEIKTKKRTQRWSAVSVDKFKVGKMTLTMEPPAPKAKSH